MTGDRIAPDRFPRQAFLGRVREISRLQSALDSARSSQGELVLMVGDAGIGKTRTVERLAALATDQGFRVLWGSCYEEHGAPPYWPWVHALRSYVEQKHVRAGLPAGGAIRRSAIVEVLEKLSDGRLG